MPATVPRQLPNPLFQIISFGVHWMLMLFHLFRPVSTASQIQLVHVFRPFGPALHGTSLNALLQFYFLKTGPGDGKVKYILLLRYDHSNYV